MSKRIPDAESVMIVDFAKKEISVRSKQKLLLDESLKTLSEEQRRYFNSVFGFILDHKRVMSSEGKYKISFHYKSRPLMKLYIKNGYTAISFTMEDERFRNLRRKANLANIPISERDVEIVVKKPETLDLIYDAVEMRIEQINEQLFYLEASKKQPKSTLRKNAQARVVKEELVIPQHILKMARKDSVSYIVVMKDPDEHSTKVDTVVPTE